MLGRKRFGFDLFDVKALTDFIRATGLAVVAPPARITLPDPDDVMFVEVALASRADAIVTGNKKHFPAGRYDGIPVLTPAEVLSLI